MFQMNDVSKRRAGVASIAAGLLVLSSLAGPALASEGAPASGDKKAPAPAKDAPAKDAKAPAKAPDAKASDAKGKDAPKAEPAKAAPAPQGPGMWASIDDFMKRTGKNLEESKVLGLRLRLHGSEEIAWSDNIFYQDRSEEFIVDRDPIPFNNGIDATPGIPKPKGRVSSFVNNFTIGGDLEMALNGNLVPLIGDGETTIKVFGAGLQSVVYQDSQGPDALNYNGHIDLPVLLNQVLKGLLPQGGKNSFYFRVEGDYQHVTDPLDVAKYEYSSTNPTLSNGGERVDFTRDEWWGKATLGWKGPRFDSKVSYRYYSFTVDDESLASADHKEDELYGEIGWRPPSSDHRFFGFGEWTAYNFDDRGPGRDVELLRNYYLWRAGPGWEGPLGTKKVKARAEVYYLGQRIIQNHADPLPRGDDTLVRGYKQYRGYGGMARAAYRPFASKNTQLQAEYARELEWSVVADHKVVDKGSVTFTHPVNEKLTAELLYNIELTNVSHGEKRIYQEAGFGLRYKLWAYTEAHFRYTFRYQNGHKEKDTYYSDASNQTFRVSSNSDFFANILSVGIDVNF